MAQKSNPNSFQTASQVNFVFGSSFHLSEYSLLLKEYLTILTNLTTLFEKRNCIVKDCFFSLNNEKSFVTLFISVLALKRSSKNKHNTIFSKKKIEISYVANKFFRVLTKFVILGVLKKCIQILLKLEKIYSLHMKFLFFSLKKLYCVYFLTNVQYVADCIKICVENY
jgi:hypothetical protein